MAKKPEKKASKTMSKSGMKKTKGGLIGLLMPATITGNTLNGGNKVNGDNQVNGDINGITGNLLKP